MLASHCLQDIISLCPRVLIINPGQLVFDGAIDEIRRWVDDRKVITAHFAAPIDGATLSRLACQVQKCSATRPDPR